ncbi:hypothetical protein CL628_03880 [bacterium]|nr:hypothetical protein [bacterium]
MSKPKAAQAAVKVGVWGVPLLSFQLNPPPLPLSARTNGWLGALIAAPWLCKPAATALETAYGSPEPPKVVAGPLPSRHVSDAIQVLPYLGLAPSTLKLPLKVNCDALTDCPFVPSNNEYPKIPLSNETNGESATTAVKNTTDPNLAAVE